MNIEQIREDPSKVRGKIEAYRRALARRHDAEQSQILAAYEALARHNAPLIRLTAAFGRAGWDAQGRPVLAIARADRQVVECSMRDELLRFDAADPSSGRSTETLRRTIPRAAMPTVPATATWNGWTRLRAIVPIVPPDAMPRRYDARKHYILWEADWAEPPRDPMLLRPIGGDLYAVLAAWDLTEVERAVLAGRVRR